MGLLGEVGSSMQAAEGSDSLAKAEGLLMLFIQGSLGVLELCLGLLQACHQCYFITFNLKGAAKRLGKNTAYRGQYDPRCLILSLFSFKC